MAVPGIISIPLGALIWCLLNYKEALRFICRCQKLANRSWTETDMSTIVVEPNPSDGM